MNLHSVKMGMACLAMVAVSVVSCISVNENLGDSLIATNQKYDLFTAEIPIENIEIGVADSLSGLSLYRFTVGAVRDELFGLTTRSTAFTLVPVADTLDFGKPGTQKFRQFHFSALADSISCDQPDQAYILQTINVYELESAVDYEANYPEIHYSSTRITEGTPMYSGKDSLTFNFTKEFGEKYLKITAEDMDTITNYTKNFPGIYMTVDPPAGNGGRINMFSLPIAVSSGVIYGSYAELKFSAEYEDRGAVDTSFLFYLGPMDLYDLSDVTTTSVSSQPQLALNLSTYESAAMAGAISDNAYVEGGRGLKPIVKAASIREKFLEEIAKQGGDPKDVIVSKAALVLPFEFPEDYSSMYLFPEYLSPTCKIVTDTSITFASIADASASDENQGVINRSTCVYEPDIALHLQTIARLEDLSKVDNYDVWLLPTATETISSASSSTTSDEQDYYNSLLYSSYYNSLYSGYSYGYSNYSSLYYLYSMYNNYSSSSSSSTQQVQMLDFHRFYRASLNGPSADNPPVLKVVYALPKKQE